MQRRQAYEAHLKMVVTQVYHCVGLSVNSSTPGGTGLVVYVTPYQICHADHILLFLAQCTVSLFPGNSRG